MAYASLNSTDSTIRALSGFLYFSLSLRSLKRSLMVTHSSGSKSLICRLKRGIEIRLVEGWTEKGSLSRWFCMVETL